MAGVVRPRPVAMLAVLLLGALWGKQSGAGMSSCVLSDAAAGTVTRVQKLAATSGQYVVQTDDGCRLLVTTGRWPQYQTGDRLHIAGGIESIASLPADLGGYAAYLDRRGIDATVRFSSITLISDQPSYSWTSAAAGQLRRRIGRMFAEPESGVLVAMLLGDRGMVPETLAEQFRRSGISHILAISGLHLSIVAGMLLAASQLLPLPPLWRTAAVVAALWAYVALVHFPISAQRAAMFWTFALAAFQMRVLIGLPTVFLLAAAIVVSRNPQVLLDVGFQLSFAAVAGIGLALFLIRRPGQDRFGLAGALAVPVGASLATWPIVSYHFGLVSVAAVLANLLVVPAVSLFLAAAVASLALDLMLPVAGAIVSVAVHMLWQWIAWVAHTTSVLPGAAFGYQIPMWLLVGWYGLLTAAAAWLLAAQGRHWREIWE